MRKDQFFYLPFLVVIVTVCANCARVGNPPGGPKDTTPPKLIAAEPADFSPHFNSRTISLRFDEFIKLNNINQQLVVSPPLSQRPDIRLRGKEILIHLNDSLLENTTYTFNFGEAIADNNEGNILENFSYVISTGDKLDSLEVGGKVVDAFTLKVPEETFIAMYDNLADSTPILQKPLYISKTDKKGIYALQNLKQDTFRIIALNDANGNFLYDPGVDMIGFLDSFLIMRPDLFSPVHSPKTMADTGDYAVDTLAPAQGKTHTSPGPGINFRLFMEEVDNQYLKTAERPTNEFFRLIFNQPLKRNVTIKLPDDTARTNWFLQEKYVVGDTLVFWLTDTALVNADNPDIIVTYYAGKDSITQVTDTVTIQVKQQPSRKTTRRNDESSDEPEERKVAVFSSISSRVPLELNQQPILVTATPVKEWDTSLIQLDRLQDSLKFPLRFSLQKDTFHLRNYHLNASWQPDTRYLITLMPGAVTDIYGYTNDTIRIPFYSRKTEEYGNLYIVLNGIKNQTIIQLLDSKDNVQRKTIVSSDTTVSFLYLKPAKYRVKAILDANRNGKWDTGNYLLHREPEWVSFYSKELNIRANWDLQENWTVRFKN